MTCKILAALMLKGVYFRELSEVVLKLLSLSPELDSEEVMLDFLMTFVPNARP